MAAGYQRWLIAKGSFFSPGAPAVVKLVDRLRKDGFLVDAGARAVRTVENTFGKDAAAKIAASTEPLPAPLTPAWLDDPDREELRMIWSASAASGAASALKYPLSRPPATDAAYALEIHRSPEYVYPTSKTIAPVSTICACGEDLAFEWDDEELVPAFTRSTGIFAECEECSRTFDPSKGTAIITNPFDGATEQVRGGAAYRFALKVDCGTSFVDDPKLAFTAELVALVESEFGRTFYEVGTTY